MQHGFNRLGYEVAWTPADRIEKSHERDIHVLFGPNYFPNTFNESNRIPTHVLCIDRCSVGNANDNVTIGWDGWGGEGSFPLMSDAEQEARFNKYCAVFPNQIHITKADHAVIIGEYPSACDDKRAIKNFYDASIQRSKTLGLKIYYRPHPHHKNAPAGTEVTSCDNILHTAQEIYTYRSSFGVDCRLRGLPVLANRASLAAGHNGEDDLWKRWLLTTQWNISELESGEALQRYMVDFSA